MEFRPNNGSFPPAIPSTTLNSGVRPYLESYDHLLGFQDHHLYQNPTPLTHPQRIPELNPNAVDLSLETAFSRLDIRNPYPQSSQCWSPNYYWETNGFENSGVDIPLNNNNNSNGFSPLYPTSLQELPSNRIRGGLPRSSSTTNLVDLRFLGFENIDDGRDFLGLDPCAHCHNLGINGSTGLFQPQRFSQSYVERGDRYPPVRPSLVNYRNRVGTAAANSLAGSSARSTSVNGLESGSDRRRWLLSSLYNHQIARNNHQQNSNSNGNGNRIYSSLDQVRGRVTTVAKDQEGCKFLQNLLGDNRPEHVEMVYLEVKDHVSELMIDQFGNYLMQKLFESCNVEQITNLLLSLVNKEIGVLTEICVHPHGTRAMQKLIGQTTTQEQRSLIVSALKLVTVDLTKDQNGHHVIQQCLAHFPPEDTKYLMKEIADKCLELAMHKSGCCVLQQAAARAQGEIQDRLVSEIIANAILLAENPYGNYVLQYLLGLRLPHAKAGILDRLRGNHITLSMNKYGSNVVEKCLRECADEYAAEMIIRELMNSLDFLNVLQDQFGNFVAQCALEVAKGDIRHQLVESILSYHSHLHSHLYGKKVLAKARASRHRV